MRGVVSYKSIFLVAWLSVSPLFSEQNAPVPHDVPAGSETHQFSDGTSAPLREFATTYAPDKDGRVLQEKFGELKVAASDEARTAKASALVDALGEPAEKALREKEIPSKELVAKHFGLDPKEQEATVLAIVAALQRKIEARKAESTIVTGPGTKPEPTQKEGVNTDVDNPESDGSGGGGGGQDYDGSYDPTVGVNGFNNDALELANNKAFRDALIRAEADRLRDQNDRDFNLRSVQQNPQDQQPPFPFIPPPLNFQPPQPAPAEPRGGDDDDDYDRPMGPPPQAGLTPQMLQMMNQNAQQAIAPFQQLLTTFAQQMPVPGAQQGAQSPIAQMTKDILALGDARFKAAVQLQEMKAQLAQQTLMPRNPMMAGPQLTWSNRGTQPMQSMPYRGPVPYSAGGSYIVRGNGTPAMGNFTNSGAAASGSTRSPLGPKSLGRSFR